VKQPHNFAPGVLEGPHRRRRALSADQLEAIGRALLLISGLASGAVAVGFIAGYLHVGGALL